MASLPLKYGKVVGRFLANVIDGPDIDDRPEFLPLAGTITFTAAAAKVLVSEAGTGPVTYVQLPEYYECELDEFGYLTWRGSRGIRLVAPTPDLNPRDWTWRASFDLSYDGRRVPMDPFDFHVPEYVPGPNPESPDIGSTGLIDLTLVAPAPHSSGNTVVTGPRGANLQIDGQVPTYAELPLAPQEGAQFVVKTDGLLYAFHAAEGGWMPQGQGVGIRGPVGTSHWNDIQNKPSTFPPVIGSSSNSAVAGNDLRLTDSRTPLPHTHPLAQVSDSTALGRSLMSASDAASVRSTLGVVAGNDTRLADIRTPTAASQIYDITLKSHMGTRVAGAGNVMPEGLRIERPIQITALTFFGNSAGTSDLVVELRKNGTTVAGTSVAVPATNHVLGKTVTGTWNFAEGERLTVHITTADANAGIGLQVSMKGTTL
ncbi:hypothetical protein [Nocardia sp. NPDC048505]|uniref:hypothetical protein n=1 Tax=unclassified Nocardia TaxID=2637762 RepID=UPI0033DA1B15